MRIVFIEGYLNDRVRRQLAQAFEGQEYRMVGYYQEGGWWSQAAYIGDEELDTDALRRIQLDVMDAYEDQPPEQDLYDEPDYFRLFYPALSVHIADGSDDTNNWGKPFEIVAWCVGGSDEGVEDAYQE